MKRTFTFKKNIRGGLTVLLESYTMQLPAKKFIFAHNVDSLVIPYDYAIGLFVSTSALQQYNLGMFIIEDAEELMKIAAEKGLVAGAPKEDVITIKEATQAIKDNNSGKIKRILNSEDHVAIDNLVTAARENLDVLNSGNIDLIEKACGVELKVE